MSSELNTFLLDSTLTLQYSFLTGFLLGGYSTAHRRALQFLAETQHEVPQTRAQALRYHRDRNYKMMAGFGVGGVKRGGQLVVVAAGYLSVKRGLELAREHSTLPLEAVPSDNTINIVPSEHFDDLIAGSIIGSSSFLLSNPKQRLFHFKKGLLLGSAFGATLSLIKYMNHKYTTLSS